MTDRYENIRKALAMGPTSGPWSEYASHQLHPYIAGADGSLIAFIESDDDVEDANAAHIAACDPDTIRALLAERDDHAQQPATVDGCHCATCTCSPGMTPSVRFDLSSAQQEGAVRDHLIRLGWTPPAAQPGGGAS